MNRVKEIRIALGYSQARLGDLAGVSAVSICLIETGRHPRPRAKTMQAIADALGCAVGDAFPDAPRKPDLEAQAAEILASSERLAPGRCRWCGRRNVKAQLAVLTVAGESVYEFGHLRCLAEYIFDNTDRQGNWKKRRNEGI